MLFRKPSAFPRIVRYCRCCWERTDPEPVRSRHWGGDAGRARTAESGQRGTCLAKFPAGAFSIPRRSWFIIASSCERISPDPVAEEVLLCVFRSQRERRRTEPRRPGPLRDPNLLSRRFPLRRAGSGRLRSIRTISSGSARSRRRTCPRGALALGRPSPPMPSFFRAGGRTRCPPADSGEEWTVI